MAHDESQKQLQQRNVEEAEPLDERLIGAEFAKAFQELARGEQTAASLESRLDDIESRIEELLASAEENARRSAEAKSNMNGGEQTNGKTQ